MNILKIADKYAGVIHTDDTGRNNCFDYWEFNKDELEAFAKEIAEQSNSRWISVDTALPDSVGETILIALKNVNSGISAEFGTVDICWLRDKENQAWTATSGKFELSEITHWAPITEPLKD